MRMPIDWDEGENAKVSSESISKWLAEGLDNAQPAFVGNQNGDVKAAIADAAKKVEADYYYPYQNHAAMEPMNATALYTPDKCEVWTGTQNGEAAFAAVLEASGLPARQMRSPQEHARRRLRPPRHAPTMSGRRCLIAKQMPGTPVKLMWSREEDMQHGRYHPITQCKLVGALRCRQQSDRVAYAHVRTIDPVRCQAGSTSRTAWTRPRSRVSPQSGEFAIGYTVPNLLIEHAMRNPHVPPGFWRGVNVNQNAIYHGMLHGRAGACGGQDPLEFRRKLMAKHPKHLARAQCGRREDRLGQAAAARASIAASRSIMAYGSYVAAAAEISVTDGSKIKVHRIVAATDPGYAVNPAQIERQIAGSFVYGLSALFYGGCTVKNGRIEQANFDTYNSMRIAEMPKVESMIVPTRRLLGRRRRADDLRCRAGGAQRLFRGDRASASARFPLKNQNINFA